MAAGRISLQTSSRIELLRVTCILCVVCVHIPSPYDVGQDFTSYPVSFIYDFLNYGLFRAATPTLSIISGYLLFSNFAVSCYPSLLQKKFRTVLLPAIVWSTGMTLLLFAAQRLGFIERRIFDLASGDIFVFFDAIFGINHLPFDGPVYFLYDLFVCFLLSPALYYILKSFPWTGALLIFVLWVSGGSDLIWIRGDILFGFYVGGLLSLRKFDVEISKRRAILVGCVFLTGCLAVAWHATRVPHAEIDRRIALELNILRVIGPVAMWSYATLISESEVAQKLTKFGSIALLIFCSHEPLVRLLGRAYFGTAQQLAPAYYPIFYVLAPVFVIVMALGAKRVLLRVSPWTLAILSGGRLGGGGRPTQRAAVGVARAPGSQPL